MVTVRDNRIPVLNGIYYGFKSFALDDLPMNKELGFCGDAFVAKVTDEEHDENGRATYDEVPEELLRAPDVLKHILNRLREI